jgi:hypothetical protein
MEQGLEITKEGDNFFLYDGMALIGGPFQTLDSARIEARRFKRLERRGKYDVMSRYFDV